MGLSQAFRLWLPIALAFAAWCATAHGQGAVEHRSVTTVAPMAGPARSAMPVISPRTLPRAALLRHNAMAAGASMRPGAASGGGDDRAAGTGSMAPQQFGTTSELAVAPYSTARASAVKLGPTKTAASVGVTSYPWRAAGKLYFKIGGLDYVCTASMIKPGVLVTAAHCVFEYGRGAGGWHTDFVFAPGQFAIGGPPPYGTWTALSELVPTSYMNGTDTCVTRGIVCNNDIALITMARNAAGALAGNTVGWYGYGWNGYSYALSFGGALLSSITQLGYPVAFDSGMMMERNDGIGGFWSSGSLKNTVLGSALTGGSSGGPWLVNFGAEPTIDPFQASIGTSSRANVVVGVTSWGYDTVGANTQGASWFGQNKEYPASSYKDSHGIDRGAGNIGFLVMTACNAHWDRC